MKYGDQMENKEVIGYKIFYNGLINRYGSNFEVGKEYRVEGKIQWGNDGNGFHMCSYPEDCFRYFEKDADLVLTKVRGFGHLYSVDDDYFGYFDMFVCEGMEILKVYSRSEVIDMMMELHLERLERFLITNQLSLSELELFKEIYKENQKILDVISYYQEGKKDTFVKKRVMYNG